MYYMCTCVSKIKVCTCSSILKWCKCINQLLANDVVHMYICRVVLVSQLLCFIHIYGTSLGAYYTQVISLSLQEMSGSQYASAV